MEILRTTKFKKDYQKIRLIGFPVEDFKMVVAKLSQGKPLPQKFKDHPLKGEFAG